MIVVTRFYSYDYKTINQYISRFVDNTNMKLTRDNIENYITLLESWI